jgi:hypothetical protein
MGVVPGVVLLPAQGTRDIDMGSGQAEHDRVERTGVAPLRARWTGPFRFAWDRLYFLLPFTVVLGVFYWFLTYGTWALEVDEQRSAIDRFYDAQAFSLLEGRLDVPEEAVTWEAFVHNGKKHGYWGIAPAFLRLPLLIFFPSLEGLLSRWFMLVACAVSMLVAYQLLHTIRHLYELDRPLSALDKTAYALFILVAGLGSSNIFMASASYANHECIVLGATFALLFYYCFLRYLVNRQLLWLAVASLAAFFSFGSRQSVGLGPLLTLVLFGASRLLPPVCAKAKLSVLRPLLDRVGVYDTTNAGGIIRPLGVASAGVLVTVGFFLFINYAKFETFNGLPLEKALSYQADAGDGRKLYEVYGGNILHLCNLRAGLYNYLSPKQIVFSNVFPWFYPRTAGEERSYPESLLLKCSDHFYSMTASMPVLCVLALLGLGSVFLAGPASRKKMLRLALLGSLAAAGTIFLAFAYSERYVHDCYPFLILASAAGLHIVLALRSPIMRRAASAVIALLAVFSVYANTALALVCQRESIALGPWPSKWSAKKAEEFCAWRTSIDRFFGQTSVAAPSGSTQPDLGWGGAVEGADAVSLVGWAWISSQPNKAVYVDIYDGHTLIGCCPAHLFRPDLRDARVGNGRHGFRYVLPTPLPDGRPHEFRVTFAGTDKDLRNSPVPPNLFPSSLEQVSGDLSLLVRPTDGQRLLREYREADAPLPVAPTELQGVKWEDGKAICACPTSDGPPYLQFALARPEFVRGVRLRYAYPAADGPSQFCLFWRDRGRYDFAEERCHRVTLPAGAQPQCLIVPVYDTITDLRIYPDDTRRPGGYACVFQLDQLRLLVRPADRDRLVQQYGQAEVPLPLTPAELHGVKWEQGTAACAYPTINEPPYLQFAMKGPEFIRGVRLRYAYPIADRPSQFCIFWRDKGHNDFAEERCHRLKLAAGVQPRTLSIAVNDRVTDLRIYPDDTQRPGGYASLFKLEQLSLLVRPADGQRLRQAYAEPEVPLPVVPSELRGVKWEDGTATCANDTPSYLQFALKQPEFVRGVRLTYAYPDANGPSQFGLFWREQGRNDFCGEDRCCRLTLPAGAKWQSITIPVGDTITDVRIEPDETQRPGGYACVFKLAQLSLLVRPADTQRLLQEYAEPDVPLTLVPSESHGVKWEEGTATCAHPTIDEPPYLQFALKQCRFVRGVRLTYAYPTADGRSQLCIFWRDKGCNDFAEERCHRLKLPPGAQSHSMIVPVNDTVTDLRIYPDDTQRPGGYACVFRLEHLGLVVRSATRERLGQDRGKK